MRGKLQNFAKAAILAIAQQNCSIDDAWLCPQVRYRFCKHQAGPRDGVLAGNLQEVNCEYL
ncbi:hypothetical protein ACS77_07000 [Pseudomonas syringae]|uniref:Uncharacterized protein n=1 Tax=Pseudomonas syringae TaxID=317 RepID=A0A0L1MJ55_PSESX|nr:hypothetical protein ACS77_07000 [Pseudomonas syringae]